MAAFAKSWRRETCGPYQGPFLAGLRWYGPVFGTIGAEWKWFSRPYAVPPADELARDQVEPQPRLPVAGILSKPGSGGAFLVHPREKLQEISTEIHAGLQAQTRDFGHGDAILT